MPASHTDPRPQTTVPELADRLAPLIKHAQLRLGALTASALAPLGISGRELAVLLVIAGQPPASQLQIAARIGVDRTTMVTLVDHLERKGLVERRPDRADRRRNVLALTDLGRQTTTQASGAADQAEQAFLEPLPPADAATLRQSLRILGFPDAE